jgi:Peptidase family M23
MSKNQNNNNLNPKITDLQPTDKSKSVGNRVNSFIKDTALPKMSILFEDYGKTILLVVTMIIVVFIFLGSVIKFQDKKAKEPVNQNIPASVEINPELDNDLAYAGFSANYKELGFKARVQTSNGTSDKIQIYNDKAMIDIQSFTFIKPADNRGANPALPELVGEKTAIEYLALKDRKFSLSSPIRDEEKKVNNYKLLDLSSVQNKGGVQFIAYQYPILAPLNKPENQISKSEISIAIKYDGLDDEKVKTELEKVKNIIQNLDRVDKKEVFIDSSNKPDIDKLFNENQNKFVQSPLLKYKFYIPDGYTLRSDDKINKVYISNEKSTLEITKRDNQTENFNTKMPNTIIVGTSKAVRPASVSEIEENQFKMPLYGGDGKTRTVDVSKDSTNKNHNLLINYVFKFNQSVDNLRKSISDFDIIVSSISENKPPSGGCELLKGQTIPFKSPFCGKELDWTQINKGFDSEHKAIDLVPNNKYTKDNPQYGRDKKEYFYATCDGKIRNYQDKETKANVIEIQCIEPDFKVQYWHDQESFWKWNDEVKAGEILGIMGETGNSENGKHLHYIIEKAGVRQDPLQLIKNN